MQGDQEHEIALFRCDERTMLLIPGGTVALGYAPEHPHFPSDEQIQTWNEKYVKPHGFPPLKGFVLEQLSSLRTVTIPPFIIDQEPIEPRWDPAFHDQIRNLLKPRGWSLPSDDEWEWAYSGGTRQIFPWGGINPFPKDSGAYPLSTFGFSLHLILPTIMNLSGKQVSEHVVVMGASANAEDGVEWYKALSTLAHTQIHLLA